eukprot:COSAG05_NODE_2829_length_2593_cov_1.595830_2_plen_99_part_00
MTGCMSEEEQDQGEALALKVQTLASSAISGLSVHTDDLLQEALALCTELDLVEIDSDADLSAEELEEGEAVVEGGATHASDREMAVELQRTLSASTPR